MVMPQDKILEFAKEERVDLIVIGNICLRGLSRARRWVAVSTMWLEEVNMSCSNSPLITIIVIPEDIS